jgi:hypothetical protein
MYLSDSDKKDFSAIILLDEIINKERVFTTILDEEDKVLEPLLISLLAKEYLTVNGTKYQATAKGEEAFELFMKRYTEFLKMYDIYSFVDLEKGEFAFSRYFDFDSDDEWNKYKSNDRFDDLRIAVALFKKLNPAEIVFMSFIDENVFDTQATGWQIDLVSNTIWDEIEHICATAIKPEDLGDDAMQDMIGQGAKLLTDLLKEEAKRQQEEQQNDSSGGNQVVEETVVEEYTYYEPYYDPFYVSPFWLVPLFLW